MSRERSAYRLTDEQIQRAKEITALDYLLSCEPGAVRRSSPHEYCLVEHDSLKISNGKWFWHSRGVGGHNALDFLLKVRGERFVSAVELLAGSGPATVRAPPRVNKPNPTPKKPFTLPEASRFPAKVVTYLQDRGISPEVISRCLQLGILYESKQHQNCVFVGRDETGKARFAAQRGTNSDFKRDVAGSNKRYGFCYPAKTSQCRRLAVFEAAIDSLSHATMQEREHWQWDGHRLALGGTAPLALTHFLEQHPEINRVYLCMDNDEAGQLAAERIQKLLAADYPHIKASVHTPAIGKDWNEQLMSQRQKEHRPMQDVGRDTAPAL